MFRSFLDKGFISAIQSTGRVLHWSTFINNIYKSFDDGYEVRGVFLDISKALDKAWHDSGFIFSKMGHRETY